jgi:hypothetical protein
MHIKLKLSFNLIVLYENRYTRNFGCVGAIFSVIITIRIAAICIRIKFRGKKAITETKGLKIWGGGASQLKVKWNGTQTDI